MHMGVWVPRVALRHSHTHPGQAGVLHGGRYAGASTALTKGADCISEPKTLSDPSPVLNRLCV